MKPLVLIKFQPVDVGSTPPCMNDTAIVTYMNRKDVRKSLYIPASVGKWELCRYVINGSTFFIPPAELFFPIFSRPVSRSYDRQTMDVYKPVKQVLDAGLRVLLYYGDTDLACNFLMGERFAMNLKLEVY